MTTSDLSELIERGLAIYERTKPKVWITPSGARVEQGPDWDSAFEFARDHLKTVLLAARAQSVELADLRAEVERLEADMRTKAARARWFYITPDQLLFGFADRLRKLLAVR